MIHPIWSLTPAVSPMIEVLDKIWNQPPGLSEPLCVFVRWAGLTHGHHTCMYFRWRMSIAQQVPLYLNLEPPWTPARRNSKPERLKNLAAYFETKFPRGEGGRLSAPGSVGRKISKEDWRSSIFSWESRAVRLDLKFPGCAIVFLTYPNVRFNKDKY